MTVDEPSGLRQRGERTLTLFMVAKLKVEGAGEGLCRVRNISSGGLMLESRMPLRPDSRVWIELRGMRTLSGTIVWARDGRAGIKFDEPVTVEELVGPVQTGRRRLLRNSQPRGPRIIVDCPIEVQLDSGRVDARLIDISQGGAKIALRLLPQRDERLILMIPGLPLKLAIVRWAGDEVGVGFAEPLPFDVLAEWLLVRAAGEYWDESAAGLA